MEFKKFLCKRKTKINLKNSLFKQHKEKKNFTQSSLSTTARPHNHNHSQAKLLVDNLILLMNSVSGWQKLFATFSTQT